MHFGYYHVGVFLLDDRKEFAVLAASNSEGGETNAGKETRIKSWRDGHSGTLRPFGRALPSMLTFTTQFTSTTPTCRIPDPRNGAAADQRARDSQCTKHPRLGLSSRGYRRRSISRRPVSDRHWKTQIYSAKQNAPSKSCIIRQIKPQTWGHILRAPGTHQLPIPPLQRQSRSKMNEPVKGNQIRRT